MKIAAAGPRVLQFCPHSWLAVWELPFSGYDSAKWKSPVTPAVGRESVCFSLMNYINCRELKPLLEGGRRPPQIVFSEEHRNAAKIAESCCLQLFAHPGQEAVGRGVGGGVEVAWGRLGRRWRGTWICPGNRGIPASKCLSMAMLWISRLGDNNYRAWTPGDNLARDQKVQWKFQNPSSDSKN